MKNILPTICWKKWVTAVMQTLWRKSTQCERQNCNFYPLLTTIVVQGNYDIFTKPTGESFIPCAGMECVAHLVTREQCQFIIQSAKQILKYYYLYSQNTCIFHFPTKREHVIFILRSIQWLLLKTINSQHEILASLWKPLAAHQISPVVS